MKSIRRVTVGLWLALSIWSIPILAQTVDQSGIITPSIKSHVVYYFEVTPTNSTGTGVIDALFALSEGPITSYTSASTILRFNNSQTQPYLDVHSGGYTRTNQVAISFGQTYQCWFEIDFTSQTYSTYVRTNGSDQPTLVHANAAFRKSNVGALNLWSSVHYTPTSTNPLQVDNTAFVDAVGDVPPDWILLGTATGTIDEDLLIVKGIDPISIAGFHQGLKIAKSAFAFIVDSDGNTLPANSTDALTSEMKLVISGSGVETSEYQLEVRTISDRKSVTWAFDAHIDEGGAVITNLHNDLTYIQFASGIEVSKYASFQVLDATGNAVEEPTTVIGTNFKVAVTAEDGSTKTFTLAVGASNQPATVISGSKKTYYQIRQQKLDLEGQIEWHVKASSDALPGTILNIKSEDVWIYFDNIKPQTVYDTYKHQIKINGEPIEPNVNARLAQYGDGAVLIGQADTFKPLTIYADQNLAGESMELSLHTHYKTLALDNMADNVESFVLKKGYMATFSANSNGTGSSKVYIADKEDIVVNTMPTGLANTVSFIRVMPWRWVNKKGFEGSPDHGDWAADAGWVYSHGGNGHNSSLNTEFVPIRHNPNWPGYAEIQTKKNVTHALFYNEPDNPVDDGFSSVEDAIAQYPNLLASGLRMVSPAPTDGGVGWLVDFINQCKAKNYRVDVAAIHFYRGGQSTDQFRNFLQDVHNRTGLPVWVTEWNNGCNWTCCLPSYESQGETIEAWTSMLEELPFVERYVLWAGCNPERSYFYNDGSRTPGGQAYHDHPSSLAWSSDRTHKNNPFPENQAEEVDKHTTLAWNPNPEAQAQQLYFGTDNPPSLLAALDGDVSSYDIGELDINQTYYWRIDDLIGGALVAGVNLEFTTVTYLKPSNPFPADSSTNVDIDLTFTWNSDPNKEELHKLYLGTHPDSLSLEATFLDQFTIYDRPSLNGTLNANTTYYWRVDEHISLRDGSELVNSGPVWSFTTGQKVLSIKPEKKLEIFPNPVENVLYFKNLNKPVSVEIYNVLGQQIFSRTTNDGIDFSQWESGMYIVKVKGYEAVKVFKP